MKVLHLLSDGPSKLSDQMINVQSKDNQVKIIDLSRKEASYESIVDDIFSHDRVVTW